jgi:carbon storage regulator
MLILTRRIGESLVIGENIVVRVVEIKGTQVRLGIEAPGDVQILREELVKRDSAAPDRNP